MDKEKVIITRTVVYEELYFVDTDLVEYEGSNVFNSLEEAKKVLEKIKLLDLIEHLKIEGYTTKDLHFLSEISYYNIHDFGLSIKCELFVNISYDIVILKEKNNDDIKEVIRKGRLLLTK